MTTSSISGLGLDIELMHRKHAKSVANAIKDKCNSEADNKGFSLLIADHSMDLLSLAKQSNAKDFNAFLRCLSVLPSSRQSTLLPFSSSENDADLILKEWLRSFTPNTSPFDGSFISSLAGYLIDVFLCFAFHT